MSKKEYVLTNDSCDKELLSNRVSLEVMDSFPPHFRELMRLRRFIPPQGYLSPNSVEVLYSMHVAVGTGMLGASEDERLTAAGNNVMCMGCWQSFHGWPMFAVTSDLLEAMVMTDPPGEITWGEIQWPLPAITFLLPDGKDMQEYLMYPPGVPPAISMGRLLRPPADQSVTLNQLLGRARMPDGGYSRDMLCFVYFDEKENRMVIHDITAKPEWTLRSSWAREHARTDPGDMPFKEEDFIRLERTIKLSVNLLAFMTSTYQPETIEEMTGAQLLRKKSEKKKKPVDALYGVRWLGQGFRLKRPPQGGHHRSPHWHWRKGTWRHQRHGPRYSLTKLIWIEPTIINKEQLEEGQS